MCPLCANPSRPAADSGSAAAADQPDGVPGEEHEPVLQGVQAREGRGQREFFGGAGTGLVKCTKASEPSFPSMSLGHHVVWPSHTSGG